MIWAYSDSVGKTMRLASGTGTPIPPEFLGIHTVHGWTVTVNPGTIGSAAVTGTRETEGRSCTWSAVVFSAEAQMLTSPAQLDPTRSDPGCEVPSGALTIGQE